MVQPTRDGVGRPKRTKSMRTGLNQVPTVIHSLLAASNIPAGGAAPSMASILEDNVNVIEINGVYVEVHECEGKPGDPSTVGGGGGRAGAPTPEGPTPGVGTDPEDCQSRFPCSGPALRCLLRSGRTVSITLVFRVQNALVSPSRNVALNPRAPRIGTHLIVPIPMPQTSTPAPEGSGPSAGKTVA
jgi:hypothetical protein